MHRLLTVAAAGTILTTGVRAGGPVFVAQERTITAATSYDGNTVTASAPGFAPFVETVAAMTPFPSPEGVPVPNSGETGIDCEINPNAITARGTLAGSGGITVTGTPVTGEAAALIDVTFTVTEPTPYRLRSSPRPSTNPRDEFEIELERVGTHAPLFAIDETSPAQSVDTTGILQPGTYLFHYEVEFTNEDGYEVRGFDFAFQMGDTCGPADYNGDGDSGTDQDVEAYFACLGGSCCDACYPADFNGDGSTTDQDIEAFFRVLAGHPC